MRIARSAEHLSTSPDRMRSAAIGLSSTCCSAVNTVWRYPATVASYAAVCSAKRPRRFAAVE